MKQSLTKEQKARKLVLTRTCNFLKSRFSLKEITKWEDIYRHTGYNDDWIKEQGNKSDLITIKDVNSWCEKLESEYLKSLNTNEKKIDNNIPTNSVGILHGVLDEVSPNAVRANSGDQQDLSTIGNKHSNKELKEDKLDTNDYGLIPSPKEKAFLYYFQKEAAAKILTKLLVEKKHAVYLIAAPGAGKTFIQGAVDRRLKDIDFCKGKTWGHIQTLAITRNSVVEQMKEVLRDHFDINPVVETEVINIEKLRARAGQIWIQEDTTIVEGEEVTKFKWKPFINPVVLFIDEGHSVKNKDSTQHKIIVSFNEIPNADTRQLYISATPFARVIDARAFAIATKKSIEHLGFPKGSILNEATWSTYAKLICGESCEPTDYVEAAVDRLMDDLDEYIVRVKGIRWQFNAINRVRVINFPSANECDGHDVELEYNEAWNKYLARKEKLEESVTDNPWLQAAIEKNMFLAAAEYAKRYIFARQMYEDVQNGYASYLAVKHKKTIIAVTKILNEKYGVSRDKIALIWGGGQTQLTAKQKLKAQVLQNKELFEKAGISLADMMLDQVDEKILEDLPAHLRLGNQSVDERNKEKFRFQSGQALYCLYTYKAGGTGLSIHHCDEKTTKWNEDYPGFAEWKLEIDKWNSKREPNKQVKPGKVRRKESGYAYLEDIPFITTRPRKGTIGPVWSPFELVQGACRGPRISSLSDTQQDFIYFAGTVESDQAFVVTHRLKCLSKVMRGMKEDWMQLIDRHKEASKVAREIANQYTIYETDEPQTEVAVGVLDEEEE